MDLVATDVPVAIAAVNGVPNLETLVWSPAWAHALDEKQVGMIIKAHLSDLVSVLEPITVYVCTSRGKAMKMSGDKMGDRFVSDDRVDLDENEWKKI